MSSSLKEFISTENKNKVHKSLSVSRLIPLSSVLPDVNVDVKTKLFDPIRDGYVDSSFLPGTSKYFVIDNTLRFLVQTDIIYPSVRNVIFLQKLSFSIFRFSLNSSSFC